MVITQSKQGQPYEVDDIQYPSVTTILGILDKSAGLIPWAVGLACEAVKQGMTPDEAKSKWREVKQDAADIGTEVHKAIERWTTLKEDCTKDRPEIQNGFLAFLDWEQSKQIKWIESEIAVVDLSVGYAGRIDATAEINGVKWLIDFKSSKAMYPEYRYQVAAYWQAYNKENAWSPCEKAGILRLDKITGVPEFIDISETLVKDFDTFKAITNVYYRLAKRRLKNNPIIKEIWGN